MEVEIEGAVEGAEEKGLKMANGVVGTSPTTKDATPEGDGEKRTEGEEKNIDEEDVSAEGAVVSEQKDGAVSEEKVVDGGAGVSESADATGDTPIVVTTENSEKANGVKDKEEMDSVDEKAAASSEGETAEVEGVSKAESDLPVSDSVSKKPDPTVQPEAAQTTSTTPSGADADATTEKLQDQAAESVRNVEDGVTDSTEKREGEVTAAKPTEEKESEDAGTNATEKVTNAVTEKGGEDRGTQPQQEEAKKDKAPASVEEESDDDDDESDGESEDESGSDDEESDEGKATTDDAMDWTLQSSSTPRTDAPPPDANKKRKRADSVDARSVQPETAKGSPARKKVRREKRSAPRRPQKGGEAESRPSGGFRDLYALEMDMLMRGDVLLCSSRDAAVFLERKGRVKGAEKNGSTVVGGSHVSHPHNESDDTLNNDEEKLREELVANLLRFTDPAPTPETPTQTHTTSLPNFPGPASTIDQDILTCERALSVSTILSNLSFSSPGNQ
ncbi:hypothetical protein HK102_009982, partial [Quaeritorhiza haematococci]